MSLIHLQRHVFETLSSLNIKDHTPERTFLVHEHMKTRRFKKFFYNLAQYLFTFSFGRALLFGAALLFLLPRKNKYSLHSSEVFFYKTATEKRALDLWKIEAQVVYLDTNFLDVLSNFLNVIVSFFSVYQNYSLFLKKNFDSKSPVYVFLRQCELLGWLLYWKEHLPQTRVQSLIVSTEGNPYGLSLFACAEILNIKSIFASHACLPLNAAPFSATTALLYGQAAKDLYLNSGCRFQNIQYLNLPTHKFSPGLPRRPRVLIATSKTLQWEPLRLLTKSLSNCEFLIRPHPNHMDSKRVYEKTGLIVVNTPQLSDCLSQIDIVWAGNSNFHLDSLIHGKPTFFIPQIEMSPADYLPFIKTLIPLWSNSLNAHENVNLFYKFASTQEWTQKMSYYLNFYKDSDHE